MTARIEAVVDAGAFGALEPVWNALLRASSASNVFLTWEWVSLWWAVYGRDSRWNVLVARDGDGRLTGTAPLKRQTVGGLVQVAEFIGAGGEVTPERLDLIVRRGSEAVVTAAMVDHLCRDPSLAGIDLEGGGVFDVLSGIEAYKYIWAGEEQTSLRVAEWRTRPIQAVARVARFLDQARHSGARAVRLRPPSLG